MSWVDHRGEFLSLALLEKIGNKVYSGPFADTQFNFAAHKGNFAPWLLGTYEHELHEVMQEIIARAYPSILNVGCGFGYYAVGLAKNKKSNISVIDIIKENEIACISNGNLNGCSNIYPSSFDTKMHVNPPNLIVMDCEGAEDEYLNTTLYNFSAIDILVECHECDKPGLTQNIIDRFDVTHHIQIIKNEPSYFDLKQIFGDVELEHFDNAIVTHEGRAGPTPWLFMTCK
jgi:hypothetical protein